ncbi:MAG: ribonuclease P protein component [Candidatus Paceibacterales bacterium]
MLSKDRRLNLKKDFKWVASGKKTYTSSFKLMYRFGSNPHPLVGIALSSQFFRKANKRNRARRLTSKSVENIYKQLRKDLNLVIMPKPEVLNTKQEDLSRELKYVKDIFTAD